MDLDPVLSEGKFARAFEMMLDALGIQWKDDPHFRDTPTRAARAWYRELFAGITQEPPLVTTFPSPGADQLNILRDIPVMGVCAHHLLPFIGKATVGYISGNGQILGLSKLSRIVNHEARRPGVQEELTEHVADEIKGYITVRSQREPQYEYEYGVGVIIKATHMCMTLRGVKHDGLMITSAVRGSLRTEPEARAEFLRLVDL